MRNLIHIDIRFALALTTAIGTWLLLLPASVAMATEIHSLASIRLQAEAFIVAYPYQSPYPPRFKLGNLDSRLRLKICREQLQVEFAHRDRVYGNTVLLVRCPSKPSWKIHLPARIDLFDDVMVASRPLLKGQKIDVNTVSMQKHNIVRLKNGYYSQPAALAELQARRNLARGTVLTPANLNPRMLVKSGQQVTLVLDYNGLQIKTTGKALQSAKLGQVVRVRNSQSQKIVEGVVSGEALVRVSI